MRLWRCAAFAPALAIRGVAPGEEPRYQGESFTCQGLTLPSSAINDDFCDCVDGSDEPGTAACGAGWFYCPNEGGVARYVYASRVGDGICDCCDGSDEWQLGGCADGCAAQHRARRERLRQRRAEMRRGVAVRQEALGAMQRQAAERRERLVALEAQRPPLLEHLVGLEELQVECRKAARLEAQELGRDASEFDEEKKVSEYAKWMERGEEKSKANQVCSGSVCISRKAVPRKEVKQIRVWSGALIDYVEFRYLFGTPLRVGEGEGSEQEAFDLEEDEVITELRGGQGGLLDRIQFVTSSGRVSKAYGGEGGENFSFQVSDGKMITGLERAVGVAGKLTGLQESLTRALTEKEKAFNEARLQVEEARQKLTAMDASLEELRSQVEEVLGPNAAYSALKKCGENQLGDYNYKICPFEDAKQGHVSLGRWKGWAEPHVGLFENGERCFSGIVRSLRVTFECGEGYVIETVKEPSQCVYEATMTHPGACDESTFQEDDRVLKPHELDHLEL